ncbi:MAG: hypothetical protein IJA55_02005 [Clostridia bacterium]|nr:hypothetical protein [Clostridia bacterium]
MSSSEKSIKINKKLIIFGAIGLLLVVAIVVALVVGLGGKNKPVKTSEKDRITTTQEANDSSYDTGIDTDDAIDTTEVIDTSDVTTDTTEPEDTEKTDVTNSPADTTGTQTNDTQPTEDPGANSTPNTVEITGAGSASEPYLEIPDADMTVTTASVPGGAELYYDIYRIGGMFITINDPDAYVICDNLQYDAVDGQVYFQLPDALASDTVSLRIGNYSGTSKAFKLIFTSAEGSYANPVIVDDISGGFNVSLEEGEEKGFYFKHYATQSGVVRFYMQATVDSIFIVTNNSNSAQRTTESDGQTDSNGNKYVDIEVNQGDELLITVGAVPNKRGKYPAVQIYWNGIYI